jgi:hypothetical protein
MIEVVMDGSILDISSAKGRCNPFAVVVVVGNRRIRFLIISIRINTDIFIISDNIRLVLEKGF